MLDYDLADTIAAVATPPGNSRLGIVRVSGPGALGLAGLFVPEGGGAPAFGPGGRGAARGTLRWAVDGTPLALPSILYRMPGPRSYTGEDVVEFVLPGSAAGLELVVEELCRRGARRAAAGEFTFRAFCHGRLTLAEAAAVADLVGSAGEAAAKAAAGRLRHGVAARLGRWREELAATAALVEAELDFSEEETPLGFWDEVGGRLRALAADGAGALAVARRDPGPGDGPQVALVGLTNAGKSSLCNLLLGEDASLVAAEPSTTRDRLERPWRLDGADLVLADCPGVDPGPGAVAAAIRARDAAAAGDGGSFSLRVAVVDTQDSAPAADGTLAQFFATLPPGPVIVAYNKCDWLGADGAECPESPDFPDSPEFPECPENPVAAPPAIAPVLRPPVPGRGSSAPAAPAPLPGATPVPGRGSSAPAAPAPLPGATPVTGRGSSAPVAPAPRPGGGSPHPAVMAAVAAGLAANPGARPLATLCLSARSGAGLAALKAQIAAAVAADCGAAQAAADQDRRAAAALAEAAAGVERALSCLEGHDLEGAAFELRDAHAALGASVGATYSEDVIAAVFSRFCVGK